MNMDLNPNPKSDQSGMLDSVTFSQDMKTVNYHNLHLSSETKYTLIFIGARNTNGDPLDMPYVIHFTTGDTLPSTTVSGKVVFPGGDPRNALVALIKPDFGVSGGTVVTEMDGSYRIPFVEPSDYQGVVVKDMDNDGEIYLEGGDIMSVYDPDGDGTSNTITVGEEDVAGIDFQLQLLEVKTAAGMYPVAQTAAKGKAADNELVLIVSETVDSVGKASEWQFWFYSDSAKKIYTFAFLASMLVEDDEIEVDWLEIEPLSANWIDSDSALAVAELNGGYDFRMNYPGAEIEALLANSSLIPLLLMMENGNGSLQHQKLCNSLKLNSGQIEGVIYQASQAQSKNLWFIAYNSERYQVFIDADSGAFIPPITAKQAVALTDSIALAEAEDAQTYLLEPEMLNVSGKAYAWEIVYHSTSQDKFFGYVVIGACLVLFSPEVTTQPPDPITEHWIDSDSALTITEAYGGEEFRAHVREWYISARRERSLWLISYLSDSSDDWMQFALDAESGHILNIAGSYVHKITAKENIAKADSAAKDFAADAHLVYVTRTGVNPAGTTNKWRTVYFSSSQDTLFEFDVYEKYLITLMNTQIPGHLVPPLSPIPENWIDSDSALAVAEANGGPEFRETIARWRISASVDCNNWIVTYRALGGQDWLEFTIDAVTAEIIDKQGTPPFVPAGDYLTHDAGDLRVSVFGNGYIGQTLTPVGDGVCYADHNNALYAGSFMIGTAERIHGMVYHKPDDMVNTIPLQAFTSDENFDKISYAAFSDSGAVAPFGLTMHQYTYSNAVDNYVIFKYTIQNYSGETIQDIVAGIFADWDIADAEKNLGGYDVDRSLAFQYEAGENISDSTYYGVVALTQMAGARVTTLREFSNSNSIYERMSTFYDEPIDSLGDYRTYIGSGPFDLENDGETTVAFAIIAGNDLTDLQNNADLAIKGWNSGILFVEDEDTFLPTDFHLSQNYPNPFNPTTSIQFSTPTPTHVSLKVYNVLGEEVLTLINEKKPAGTFEIYFYATKLSSGVYFYTLRAGAFIETKKCLLIK